MPVDGFFGRSAGLPVRDEAVGAGARGVPHRHHVVVQLAAPLARLRRGRCGVVIGLA
jgi:hypothetical protein